MSAKSRFELVLFGVFLVALGVRLIVKPLAARPDDDSPGARVVGGFVIIAFGVALVAVGYDLIHTGR